MYETRGLGADLLSTTQLISTKTRTARKSFLEERKEKISGIPPGGILYAGIRLLVLDRGCS